MRKWLGHHQEICRTGLTGKRRDAWKKASGGWSQREAEVPEIITVSDAVESTNVDLDGKSRREQPEARSSRGEREAPGKGSEGNQKKPSNTQEKQRVRTRKTLSYWPSSVVIDESEASYTTN